MLGSLTEGYRKLHPIETKALAKPKPLKIEAK
jgi:hypothetical protein